MKQTLWVVCFFAASLGLAAADPAIGTWTLLSDSDSPGDTGAPATLTVAAWGDNGRELTYHIMLPQVGMGTLVIQTGMDGKDAPVVANGRPIGETMAITRQDDHHATAVVKWQGTAIGTSSVTVSDDGTTMTVVTDLAADTPTAPAGKATQVWKKQ